MTRNCKHGLDIQTCTRAKCIAERPIRVEPVIKVLAALGLIQAVLIVLRHWYGTP